MGIFLIDSDLYWKLAIFIQLFRYKTGCIFVNGRNVGRFWEIGPQKRLYLPGPWLQTGGNDIVIFEG